MATYAVWVNNELTLFKDIRTERIVGLQLTSGRYKIVTQRARRKKH